MKKNRMFGVLVALAMLVGVFSCVVPMGYVSASEPTPSRDISLSLMPSCEMLNANNGPVSIWVDVRFNIPQGKKVYVVYLMGQSETEGVSFGQTFQKEMTFNGRFSVRFELLNRAIAKNGYKFFAWAVEKNGTGVVARKEVKMFTDFPAVSVRNPVSWRVDKDHFKVSFSVENIKDVCSFYGAGVLVEVEVRVQCASIYSYFPTKEVIVVSPYDGKETIDNRVYQPTRDGQVCVSVPIHSNDKNDVHWWRVIIHHPNGRRIVYEQGDGYRMYKANLDKYEPTP